MPQSPSSSSSSSFTSGSDSSGESSGADAQEETFPGAVDSRVASKGSAEEEAEPDSESESESGSESDSESDAESDVVTTTTNGSLRGKNLDSPNQFMLLSRKHAESGMKTPVRTSSEKKESKQERQHGSGRQEPKELESKREGTSSTLKGKKADSLKRFKDSSEAEEKESSKKLKKSADGAGRSDAKINSIEGSRQKKEVKGKSSEQVTTANGSPEKKDRKSEVKKSKPSAEVEGSKKERSERDGNEDVKKPERKNEESEIGLLSSEKPKLWTPKDEIMVSKEMVKALGQGVDFTSKKSDACWYNLGKKLENRLEGRWDSSKIFEKTRRMRTRYTQMAEKVRDLKTPYKFRNETDEELFGIWDLIWGNENLAKGAGTKNDRKELKVKPENEKALTKDKKFKAGAGIDKEEVDDDENNMKKKPKLKVADEAVEGKNRGSKSSPSPSKTEVKENHNETEETMRSHDVSDEDSAEESEEHVVLPEKKSSEPPIEVDMKEITNMEASSLSDLQRYMQHEIKSLALGLGEASIEIQREWQNKTIELMETCMKEAAKQIVSVIRYEMKSFSRDRNSNPLAVSGIDLTSFDLDTMESLKGEWFELQRKELEAHKAKVDLMLRANELEVEKLKRNGHVE